ncbi:MAG: DNA methylase [Lachnospiraceae bacterium]|nr:DNA methylase [Lachnospiraceae bacterium]
MKQYIAIDLKSFYASVECRERGLDPLTARLVVADESRTAKTICLAVSPALKAYGVPGRARLFEVNKKAKEAQIDFVIAKPRMALYMDYSTRIYDIYLKYVSKEDMHVYSVDEVFIDITSYLETYKKTAEEMAIIMIKDVLETTGITATAGIGTNMYLAKIAMDIVAKHAPADEKGVRIASLDEISYRRLLWDHKPLTDFWRLGKGYEKRLESVGIYTMGEVARCALGKETDYYNEDLLYKLFGINAELLIDHAFGYEPCTIEEIRSYRPETTSISSGQVLTRPYEHEETRLIVKEMTELLCLDLVKKRIVTKQIILTVGYDIDNLIDPERARKYAGKITIDRYGRRIPKHAHGTENLSKYTSSNVIIGEAMMRLFDRIMDKDLLSRRITVVANDVIPEREAYERNRHEQMDLFSDFGIEMIPSSGAEANEGTVTNPKKITDEAEEKQRRVQQAAIQIKEKYGKNAILKGMNLQKGGTTIERNAQIGGHKA